MTDAEMTAPLFDKVTLLGLGLIGSSLGHAMKRAGLARHISGHARSQETREAALEIGFVDQVHESANEAVKGADLVILCVPVGVCGPLCAQIAGDLKRGAIVSDVGSVKEAVIRACAPHIPKGVHFIPAHPMAGTEFSGPHAGFAELFERKWCLLTPLPDTDQAALDRLCNLWTKCGANVEVMSAHHHDLVAAIVSHLPHLIAFNIVGTADDLEDITEREVIKFAAGGFRDFTRIAASDPTMWRDVFLNNKEAVLTMLEHFNKDLERLTNAIRQDDGALLFDHFKRTRHIRKGILEEEKE